MTTSPNASAESADIIAVSHVHSSWSYDGSWSIPALATAFADRGNRVLMMTEHDRGFSESHYAKYRGACADASSEGICVLPGIEYSDSANRVHVLVWGAPFLGEGRPTDEILKAANAHGGVAVFAHPDRRDAWECFEPTWSEHLLGVEVWNRKYDGWAPGHRGAGILSEHTIPFVGLDFHTRRQFFPLAMKLAINEEINEDSVLHCLRNRRCSPLAFGLRLDQSSFQRKLSLLRRAEQGRRTLAILKRYSMRSFASVSR